MYGSVILLNEILPKRGSVDVFILFFVRSVIFPGIVSRVHDADYTTRRYILCGRTKNVLYRRSTVSIIRLPRYLGVLVQSSIG